MVPAFLSFVLGVRFCLSCAPLPALIDVVSAWAREAKRVEKNIEGPHGAMAILRWDPQTHHFIVKDRQSRLFEYALSHLHIDIRSPAPWIPLCDVFESRDAFTLKAETPGLALDDLAVEVDGSRITVVGRRRKREDGGDETYFLLERSYGRFIRSFVLPSETQEDQVTVELSDGLLTVIAPKKEAPEGKRVKVEIT